MLPLLLYTPVLVVCHRIPLALYWMCHGLADTLGVSSSVLKSYTRNEEGIYST